MKPQPLSFPLGRALLLSLLLALVAGPPGVAQSAPLTPTAQRLLEQYAATAKQEDPAFSGFQVARGKAFYASEYRNPEGKMQSCATCHMPNPAKHGRSDVGKVLDPLAPAANPRRFTDADEIEKWFRRNCRGVLGRLCTAREKGDFMVFVFSLN